jgi:hypothetical protein
VELKALLLRTIFIRLPPFLFNILSFHDFSFFFFFLLLAKFLSCILLVYLSCAFALFNKFVITCI